MKYILLNTLFTWFNVETIILVLSVQEVLTHFILYGSRLTGHMVFILALIHTLSDFEFFSYCVSKKCCSSSYSDVLYKMNKTQRKYSTVLSLTRLIWHIVIKRFIIFSLTLFRRFTSIHCALMNATHRWCRGRLHGLLPWVPAVHNWPLLS